jgi:hypothetical protein
MQPSDMKLADLVAELRERLRHLASGPARDPGSARSPGALGPVGRLSLAIRLLAEALRTRRDPEAAAAATAFDELATRLAGQSEPADEDPRRADLEQLMSAFEELARAWDRGSTSDLRGPWSRVREAGDAIWSVPVAGEPRVEAATSRGKPAAPRSDPDLAPGGNELREVWLLVAGDVRRAALTRRLQQAGVTVVVPDDASGLVARLAEARPDAVVCDDAAPTRHHRQLRELLPADAPPLVVVQADRRQAASTRAVWTPPFRTCDLVAALGA